MQKFTLTLILPVRLKEIGAGGLDQLSKVGYN